MHKQQLRNMQKRNNKSTYIRVIGVTGIKKTRIQDNWRKRAREVKNSVGEDENTA